MLERFALAGKGTAGFFRIEVPVKRISRLTDFMVQPLGDEFVGDFLRQGIGKLAAFPEAFQEFVHGRFAGAGRFRDLAAAHTVCVVEH